MELFGEFLLNAQGKMSRCWYPYPEPIEALKETQPETYQAFRDYANVLENHYKDMQDINLPREGETLHLTNEKWQLTAKAL